MSNVNGQAECQRKLEALREAAEQLVREINEWEMAIGNIIKRRPNAVQWDTMSRVRRAIEASR